MDPNFTVYQIMRDNEESTTVRKFYVYYNIRL